MKSSIERKLHFPKPDLRFKAVQPELRSVQGGGFSCHISSAARVSSSGLCQVRVRGLNGDRGGGCYDQCSLTEESVLKSSLASGGGARLCIVTRKGLQETADTHDSGENESRTPPAAPLSVQRRNLLGWFARFSAPPPSRPPPPAPSQLQLLLSSESLPCLPSAASSWH